MIGCQNIAISSFGVGCCSKTKFTLGLHAVFYVPTINIELSLFLVYMLGYSMSTMYKLNANLVYFENVNLVQTFFTLSL